MKMSEAYSDEQTFTETVNLFLKHLLGLLQMLWFCALFEILFRV